MDEVENFFCQFPNPWTLRVSGMGCYTSKCEKVKITAPYTAYTAAANMWTDLGNMYVNRSQTMDVDIGIEAEQFPEKEYINGIFVAMRLWEETNSGVGQRTMALIHSTKGKAHLHLDSDSYHGIRFDNCHTPLPPPSRVGERTGAVVCVMGGSLRQSYCVM
jgi:hypothetical protein